MRWNCPACGFKVSLDDNEFPFTCPACKNTCKTRESKAKTKKQSFGPSTTRKSSGPGTELKLIFESIGIIPTEDCPCNDYMLQMNEWGVEGCITNKQTILKWLKNGYSKRNWRETLRATIRAAGTSLVFKCNPLDPFPGLLEEAINRTISKEKDNAKG